MADLTNADLRHRLAVDNPPPPIHKDMQGSDSSVPLSPQWLLPKLGDNKLGQAAGDPHPHVGKRTDPVKALENVEDLNVAEKKKDVFRPTLYGMEKGHQDHWGDEEREANSAVRRDLRREGEELGDSRKLERWSNSSSRNLGDARRFPSERWSESGSRESAYETRRESKWSTRWGPDDKESENWREKWSVKDGETSHDKGAHHQTIHAKDINSQGKDTDKEGEHYSRSWRSSPSVNRGRGESSPYFSSTKNKPAPTFGYGRGKGDTGASVFPVDRSRVGSSSSGNVSGGPTRQFPLGTSSDRSNCSHRDPPVLRYNRMKLLDIYRRTDLRGYRMSFEVQEFPSLTQVDPLVPLALTASIPEELVIMEAIDKGDILSSGVPQASKDGSSVKNSVESGLLPLTKSGIGDDVAPVLSSHRDERTDHVKKDHSCYVESALSDKCSRGFDSNVPSSESLCQYHEVKLTAEAFKLKVPPNKVYDSSNREVSKLENTIPWRTQSVGGESLWLSNDLRALADDRPGSSGMGWLNTREETGIEPRNRRADSSSYLGGDPQWKDTGNLQSDVRAEYRIRRQPSETSGQGGEGLVHAHGLGDPFIRKDKLSDRKPQQYPSPEHLSLFYKDPHGQIQGPFSGSNLIEWFDAGYFGIDLLVRLASAPADTPFSLLGDVIPQLRKRIRPPPGFGAVRLKDIAEVSNRGKFGGPGSIHEGVSDFELMKNGQELRNESKVDAENRFLESLMSGRISRSLSESYSLSEGMQGHNGLAGGRPSLGIENMIDMKYVPQKMPLEQQSPVLSPYPPGRESPILSKEDTIREFPTRKFIPQVGEVPHHIPQSPQHMDLLSVLQSAANITPPPFNSALPLWMNFPEVKALKNSHGSMDILKDTIDLHPNQQNSQTGFGTSPRMLQPQFQPSLLNHGFSSGVIPQEKLVASEFDQDAQMVNLLRQQYMLTQQMHSQVPLTTHLNQMELILLMQRQKQEQQQNQLLLQQQQQHLLSHALSGHHSHKHYDEQSFGPLNTGIENENTPLKSPILQQMHEVSQSNRQLHGLDSNDSHVPGISNLNLHGAQEASITDGTEHLPRNLPNQFIDLSSHSNAMDAPPLTQTPNAKQLVSITNIVSAGEGSAQEAFLPRLNSMAMGTSVASQGSQQTNEIVTIASDAVNNLNLLEKVEGSLDSKPSVSEMIDHVEAAELKGVEDAEQCEVKKASEKKSRKHKNSQLRATAEYGKGSLKAAPAQKSRTNFETGGTEKDIRVEAAEPLYRTTPEAGGENCAQSLMESLDSHDAHLPSEGALGKKTKVDEVKVKEGDFVLSLPNNQAWKPAPGQKAKPLLEIQVEEQRRVKTQSLTVDTIPEIMPTDFSGSSINSEQKHTVDTFQCGSLVQSISEKPENPWNSRNRSQLHDVLATEVFPRVSGGKDIISEEKGTSLPPISQIVTQNETAVDDDDFIEAKDTRKSRKKAAKNKGVAVKASLPNNSAGLSVSPSTSEQTKATRQTQQDKDLLPSPPAAPSLGDFVFWKGDQASTVPTPAWSTDSVKLQKSAFLRDIFKEQDKKTKSGQQQTPIPTPAKIQPSKGSGGSSSSVRVVGSSPSKVPFPINSKPVTATPVNSLVLGQQKTGMEDDLFWGPLNQAKKGNRSDLPSLANPNSQKVKGTSVKGSYGEGSSKKASSSKPAEHSITSSPAITQSLSKGKKDPESKYSEATDFRDWCEAEWLRLTGTNDTSFLEFCLKQSTTEAEVLLRENLTSLDRNHEFIDKFINYKEFLSSEIIEIAFRGRRSSPKVSGPQESHGDAEADDGVDGSSKGKKKGKKGKKLSPALLGFNVVSNRIMMGEIQTIED